MGMPVRAPGFESPDTERRNGEKRNKTSGRGRWAASEGARRGGRREPQTCRSHALLVNTRLALLTFYQINVPGPSSKLLSVSAFDFRSKTELITVVVSLLRQFVVEFDSGHVFGRRGM